MKQRYGICLESKNDQWPIGPTQSFIPYSDHNGSSNGFCWVLSLLSSLSIGIIREVTLYVYTCSLSEFPVLVVSISWIKGIIFLAYLLPFSIFAFSTFFYFDFEPFWWRRYDWIRCCCDGLLLTSIARNGICLINLGFFFCWKFGLLPWFHQFGGWLL